MRHGLWRSLAVVAAIAALGPTVARAEDPPFVGWSQIAPSLSGPYDPNDPNLCNRGADQCVHAVIKEMDRRFDPLSRSCDHSAVFSLTYLRTTEEYHRFWHEGHFADPNWLNHYDAVFAGYYFDAWDDWTKGHRDRVPRAWVVAFDAADHKQVQGIGNLLLGMSAHINRDLPFVLHEIGLVAPDGTSRKPDHDRVNEFLNRVSDALYPELVDRFDPTIDDGNIQGTTADDLGAFQVVPAWRERAWRNAERLAAANGDSERAQVAASIEHDADLTAQGIRNNYSYSALSQFKAADRDTYCFSKLS